MTEFSELASVLDSISATTKRKEKTRLIAGFLKDIHDDDIEIAALLLAGRIFAESDERTLNMSWAGILGAIQKAMEIDIKEIEKHYKGDAGEAIASVLESTNIPRQQVLYVEPLTLELVQSTIRRIALSEGKGSKSEREALLSNLLQSASPREIRYLVALFLGDMRTGVSDAMLIDGISEAFDIEGDLLRRAWSFSGDIGKVARVASFSGIEGISKIEIQLFTPIKPMLATPGDSVGEVLSDVSERYYLEMKYDGARVQIHKQYEEVRIYSRRLIEVTQSLPEIVKIVNERIKVESVILDGEIIAVNQEGVPAPFQEVMKRFGRTQEIEDAMAEVQIQLFVFDIILKDSQCLVDSDYACRRDILESTVPSELIAPRYTFSSLHEAEEFFESSKASGHEGVMIKKGSSNYIPGK
ncbi:MAG: ATP-dependent DNA ligase, partial [Candidatus Thorarchaeota archaeon]